MRIQKLTGTNVAAGSTYAVQAKDFGKTILLNTLTGSVATLPAAVGSGGKIRFVVSLAPTSNNHIIKVSNTTDVIAGVCVLAPTTIAQAVTVNSAEAAGGTDDTITMNGTTSGGIVGSWLELEDTAAGLWTLKGQLVASGTLTTPFSATV